MNRILGLIKIAIRIESAQTKFSCELISQRRSSCKTWYARRRPRPHVRGWWRSNSTTPKSNWSTTTRYITRSTRRLGTSGDTLHIQQFTVNGGPPADAISNLPAEINGIYIQLRGTVLFEVTIPAIDMVFTYTGKDYSWSLELPWSYAYDNTEGLCGKCGLIDFQNKFYRHE